MQPYAQTYPADYCILMGAVFYLPSSLEYQKAHPFALAEHQDVLVLGVLSPVMEGRLALL